MELLNELQVLRIAYRKAGEHLEKEAVLRKARHDLRPNETPLQVGERILARIYGFKSRHNIADIWHPCVVYNVCRIERADGTDRQTDKIVYLSICT